MNFRKIIFRSLAAMMSLGLCLLILQLSKPVFEERFKSKILGSRHISPINSTNINFSETDDLKYYYEPIPNSKETFNPDWLGKTIVNTINSDGLNDGSNYEIPKNPRTYRIIALGDSFTFGHFVETNESWPEQLEVKLNAQACTDINKFEVLNFGYPGYDIAYSSERFRRAGTKYQPDLVIWLINPWNIENPNELMIPFIKDEDKGSEAAIKIAVDEVRKKYGQSAGTQYAQKYMKLFFESTDSDVVIFTLEKLSENHSKLIGDFLTPIYLFDFHGSPDLKLPDEHPNPSGHNLIAEKLTGLVLKKTCK